MRRPAAFLADPEPLAELHAVDSLLQRRVALQDRATAFGLRMVIDRIARLGGVLGHPSFRLPGGVIGVAALALDPSLDLRPAVAVPLPQPGMAAALVVVRPRVEAAFRLHRADRGRHGVVVVAGLAQLADDGLNVLAARQLADAALRPCADTGATLGSLGLSAAEDPLDGIPAPADGTAYPPAALDTLLLQLRLIRIGSGLLRRLVAVARGDGTDGDRQTNPQHGRQEEVLPVTSAARIRPICASTAPTLVATQSPKNASATVFQPPTAFAASLAPTMKSRMPFPTSSHGISRRVLANSSSLATMSDWIQSLLASIHFWNRSIRSTMTGVTRVMIARPKLSEVCRRVSMEVWSRCAASASSFRTRPTLPDLASASISLARPWISSAAVS